MAERKEAFESYLPEEVGKIDNSILRVEGNYIILCVAKDANTVNNVINEYTNNNNKYEDRIFMFNNK